MGGEVVLFAAQGVLAHEAIETFARLDVSIVAAVVTGPPEWDMSGLANIVDINAVGEMLIKYPVVVPVWGPVSRRRAVEQARDAGFAEFMTVVDPTAIVAGSAQLDQGVFVHSSANVGAGVKLGEFAMINRATLIGHHCVFDAFVSTGGGATLASRCHIGEGAVLGAGCVLIPNQTVGAYAIVGGGAVVIRDVEAKITVAGNPARKIKDKGITPPEAQS